MIFGAILGLYIVFVIICAGKKNFRIGIAPLIAPVTPPVVLSLLAFSTRIFDDTAQSLKIVFFVTLVASYTFSIVGIPIYFALRRLGILGWWQLAFSCGVIAILIGFLFRPVGGQWSELIFFFCGASTALVGWVIAFYKNPRSLKNEIHNAST